MLWWRKKLFFGPSWLAVFGTLSLINVNGILFMIFTFDFHISIIFIALYLHIGSNVFLWILSVMDPGIIPRRIVKVHKKYDSQDIFFRVNWLSDNFRLKFWSTWMIFRPPRSSHWSTWDNWVLRWDHHCPWVGTWIGRRNFKYFYYFLIHIALY